MIFVPALKSVGMHVALGELVAQEANRGEQDQRGRLDWRDIRADWIRGESVSQGPIEPFLPLRKK